MDKPKLHFSRLARAISFGVFGGFFGDFSFDYKNTV